MKRNTSLQIKQWHALPSHFAINFLNFVTVPALFISSFRAVVGKLRFFHLYLVAPLACPSVICKYILILKHTMFLTLSSLWCKYIKEFCLEIS